jgi:hypothetical protein
MLIERAQQNALDDPGTVTGAPAGAGDSGKSGGGGGTPGKTFAELMAELAAEAEAVKLIGMEREIHNGILAMEGELKRSLTQSERELATAAIRNLEISKEAGSVLEELRGPQEDFANRLAAINMLMQEGTLSAQEYNEAMLNLGTSTELTGNSLMGGLMVGLNRVMAKSLEFGENIAQWVVGSFEAASDAVVEFAKTGQVNMRQFFQDIFANLLKLATDQLFAQLLSMVFGGPLGMGGGGGGLGGVLGGLMGFSTGGSIMPSGPGNTDSQLVAFKKRPDERVDILTPQQQRAQQNMMSGASSQTSSGSTTNLQVAVVLSEDDIESVFSGERGDRLIVRGIQKNSSTVKQIVNK